MVGISVARLYRTPQGTVADTMYAMIGLFADCVADEVCSFCLLPD